VRIQLVPFSCNEIIEAREKNVKGAIEKVSQLEKSCGSDAFVAVAKIVTVHGGIFLSGLRRTRSIVRSPDVEKRIKPVLQASLTPVFIRFSPPREL
jgi:hypothetical protein